MVIAIAVLATVVLASLLALMMQAHRLRQEGETSKKRLEQQIQLTDAYAWEVESKRYELMETLKQLKQAHDYSISINQNLEEEVNKRTKALLHQSQKIVEYHFINSHKLRAPVTRIIGLVSLFDKGSSSQSNHTIIDHLTIVSRELDYIVHEIQQTLYCAENREALKSNLSTT